MQKVARSADDLGRILRQHRHNHDLTQTELAAKTQTHQRLISRLEAGRLSRSINIIFKILAILDLEVEVRPRQKTSAQDIADIFR